jgi:hypothetical protein
MISKVIGKIILIITMILANNLSLAAQEFEYIPGSKIKTYISSSNLNRIEFGRGGLAQVIGDDNKYKIITDNRGQNIFLLPKIPASQTLELALVNLSGNVADLVLETKDIEGQVIRIFSDGFSDNRSNLHWQPVATTQVQAQTRKQEQEIVQMIRSMLADREGKYYLLHVKRKIDRLKTMGLSIEQDRIYRFGDLIGARLKVSNRKSKTVIYLKESDFSNIFESPLATCIEKRVLPPRTTGFVWIVTKETGK